MTTPALQLRGVRKRYGRAVALDGLDVVVPPGVICGLIGPNGAGKTTAFGIVGGLIRADAGEVDVLGQGTLDPYRLPGKVTLLPQDCELNPSTPVRTLLTYYGRLQGLTAKTARVAADRVLDEVALADRATSKIKQLSHGMRRRVALAQALVGEPELVLLDEPTSGLDPELVVRMRDLFALQRGKRTLVISSHNLAELEAVCDHVVFMERGRCVNAGSLAAVTNRGLLLNYELQQPIALDSVQAACEDFSFSWDGSTLLVQASAGWDAPGINAKVVPLLLAADARLLEIRQGRSLEDAYLAGRK